MSYIPGLEKPSFSSSGWYGDDMRNRVTRKKDEKDQQQGQNRQQYSSGASAGSFSSRVMSLGHGYDITCKWEPFRKMILTQWNRLSAWELDAIGPNRSKLAALIQTKYGVETHLIENYLRNFERALPLA